MSYRLIRTLRGNYGYIYEFSKKGYIYKDFQLYRYAGVNPLSVYDVLPSSDHADIYERISEFKEEQLDYLIIDDINNVTYKTQELKDCYERV